TPRQVPACSVVNGLSRAVAVLHAGPNPCGDRSLRSGNPGRRYRGAAEFPMKVTLLGGGYPSQGQLRPRTGVVGASPSRTVRAVYPARLTSERHPPAQGEARGRGWWLRG